MRQAKKSSRSGVSITIGDFVTVPRANAIPFLSSILTQTGYGQTLLRELSSDENKTSSVVEWPAVVQVLSLWRDDDKGQNRFHGRFVIF